MSESPEEFALLQMRRACGDALEIMQFETSYIFWDDDRCAKALFQKFAEYFGSLLNTGNTPEEARDRTIQLILKFRNRFLLTAMQKRFDPNQTPYGEGEPIRENWEKMNVPHSLEWTTITYAQIQQMIDCALEKLREDLLFTAERTFDDASEENAEAVMRDLLGDT